MMYYFCTYFDQQYLPRGLALYQSLVRHCKSFQLWVLCMDSASHEVLTRMSLPNINLIALADFENGDEELLIAKQNRTPIKAYVLEKEITKSQGINKRLQQLSKI